MNGGLSRGRDNGSPRARTVAGSPGFALTRLGRLSSILLATALIAAGCSRQPGEQESATPGPSAIASESTAISPVPDPSDTNLVVEQTIVDRPGVPPSLYDKYWAARGQVGQIGTTARIVMPSNEWILGSDAGRVASHLVDEELDPLIGEEGLEVVVRDIRTGGTLRTFTAAVWVTDAILVGPTLFWTGYELPYDPFNPSDAGVWAIDVSEATGAPQVVIPSGELSSTYGSSAVRGLLRLTDSGRSVITLIEGDSSRATEVIDVATLTLRRSIEDEFAIEVVRDLAVVAPLHKDRGDPDRPSRLRLIDLTSGSEVGEGIRTSEVVSSFVGVDEVYIQYNRDGLESRVTAIALGSGEVRVLRVQLGTPETLELSHRLSAPDFLVLLPVDGAALGDDGKAHLPVSLLEPNGEIHLDAFEIGNP